jgi:hypothetical protein
MDNTHVGQLVDRYVTEHQATQTLLKEGRWEVLTGTTKVVVHHFPQRSRWEGLTTLAVNIDLGDDVANLKYHYAWISYPEFDKVAYDSFAYAINQLLRQYESDLEFERLLHPNSTASTGS